MFYKNIYFLFLVLLGITVIILYFYSYEKPINDIGKEGLTFEQNEFKGFGLSTDTSKSIIDIDAVRNGNVGKDGIPAINEPKFVSLEDANVNYDTRGILLSINNVVRFYPYNILVWHEIVNDSIDNVYFSVTFCPLCDSGIVFDRRVEGTVLKFGVSGFLFESNLLMYDTKTESLWSQARGEAVIGEYAGTELKILPFQLLTFAEVRDKYVDAQVLSTNTGYSRNYNSVPYGGYLDNEETIFPISIQDKRFHSKELFYIIPFEGMSYAARYKEIPQGESTLGADGTTFNFERDGGEIIVTKDGELVPTYFELWFSWAVHHQEDGVVLEKGNKG